MKEQVEDIANKINDEFSRFSYNKDKAGWVKFNNGKKKEKLRSWVAKKAKWLTKYNNYTFLNNKEFLINYYNKDGLTGVQDIFKIQVEEILQNLKDDEGRKTT